VGTGTHVISRDHAPPILTIITQGFLTIMTQGGDRILMIMTHPRRVRFSRS
jgi:hypothetical protein